MPADLTPLSRRGVAPIHFAVGVPISLRTATNALSPHGPRASVPAFASDRHEREPIAGGSPTPSTGSADALAGLVYLPRPSRCPDARAFPTSRSGRDARGPGRNRRSS